MLCLRPQGERPGHTPQRLQTSQRGRKRLAASAESLSLKPPTRSSFENFDLKFRQPGERRGPGRNRRNGAAKWRWRKSVVSPAALPCIQSITSSQILHWNTSCIRLAWRGRASRVRGAPAWASRGSHVRPTCTEVWRMHVMSAMGASTVCWRILPRSGRGSNKAHPDAAWLQPLGAVGCELLDRSSSGSIPISEQQPKCLTVARNRYTAMTWACRALLRHSELSQRSSGRTNSSPYS